MPPFVSTSADATLQVPDEIEGTPVDADVFSPVPPMDAVIVGKSPVAIALNAGAPAVDVANIACVDVVEVAPITNVPVTSGNVAVLPLVSVAGVIVTDKLVVPPDRPSSFTPSCVDACNVVIPEML